MTRIKKTAILIGDIALLYGALALTLLVRYPVADFGERWGDHLVPFSLVFIGWILIFYLVDLYHSRSFQGRHTAFQFLARGAIIAGALSIIAFYLFGSFFSLTPKTNLGLFIVIFFSLGYLWRRVLLLFIQHRGLRLVLLGNSPAVTEIAGHLKSHRHTGFDLQEWIQSWHERPLGSDLLEMKPHAIVAHSAATKNDHVLGTLYRLLAHETTLYNFVDFYELTFEKVPVDELEERWFIEHVSTRRPFYDGAKRILDVLLSATLLLVLAIPAVIIAFLIAATSRGPIIYRQKRTGQHGNPFVLYKFRTMRVDADKTGPEWTTPGDDRVTAVGKLLRFTHLDEIPQLWNILRGDISFTGPRPESVGLAEKYSELPYYDIRHVVKPGLTGWAQVKYRPSASLEEAREKLCYDIYYIKNRSFFLDLLIMVRTVRYLLLGSE